MQSSLWSRYRKKKVLIVMMNMLKHVDRGEDDGCDNDAADDGYADDGSTGDAAVRALASHHYSPGFDFWMQHHM